MPMQTITAIFDSSADAENARRRLVVLGLAESDVRIVDQGSTQGITDSHKGIWESIKDFFIADEDRGMYSEGLRRGGCLLTARVDDRYASEAIEALDESGAVDLDERANQWRSEGWAETEPTLGATSAATRGEGAMESASTEERVPIVEERLRVGKRDVNGGTVRVRSYIVEEPVHEDVRLRDERVEVERRPVSSAANRAGDAALLRERTIEMTETSEEAVVQKDAVVTEEVAVKKFTGERTKGIDETVRHTEVEVDDSRSDKPVAGKSARTKTTQDRSRRP